MQAFRRDVRGAGLGIGTRQLRLLYVAFILALPKMTENFGALQEINDRLTSQLKSEYILNIEEEFDYIVGETYEYILFNTM